MALTAGQGGALILTLLALFFSRDLYSLMQGSPEEAKAEMTAASATAQQLDQQSLGGRVHVSFCTRNAFQEVQQLMARERPGVEVVPSYYPLSPAKKAAVTALSVLQYGAMGAILFADAVSELLRTNLGIQVDPAMVASVKAKRVQWCLGLWWIGNVIKNGLQSTGAFEVFYDGQEIFSKLKMGRMPNVDDLTAGIQAIAAGRRPSSMAA